MSADGDMVRTTEAILDELSRKVQHILSMDREDECPIEGISCTSHGLSELVTLFAIAANDVAEADIGRNRTLWGMY